MKCSASQTTSSVSSASPALAAGGDASQDARIRDVATQFEAALVSVALRPTTDALGPMGTLMGQRLSMKIAAGMSDPLYEQLRSQIG